MQVQVKLTRPFINLALVSLQFFIGGHAYMVDNNPYRHRETLDPNRNYQLEWFADMKAERVTFNVTVKTRGYVGFGLSTNGKMSGADIVIGGVQSNGKSYFSDRHAVGNQLPELDPSQDWILHNAWENATHTSLRFSRAFDTCDPQDLPITTDRIALIWAFGEGDDDIEYHHRNRGIFNAYLLDPDYTPQIVRNSNNSVVEINGLDDPGVKVWSIDTSLDIPAEDTTYWCTMHKGPNISAKHHIIGLEIAFPNEISRRHTHHLIFHRCNAPRGRTARSMFEPFVQHRGHRCLIWRNPSGPIPTEYCTETIHAWGIGGKAYFNPPHVGFPIGLAQDEYYVVQVHYDNPTLLPNLKVDLKIDLFYTSNLRPIEGGIIQVRVPSPGVTPSILVPPSSISHQVRAHCSPACSRRVFPNQGITIFSALLHSHNSGRRLRLQHFRKSRELPWIMNDDNYGFENQNFRTMPQEIKVLPGDHLVQGCTYDNTWTNGTVVGGFSSRQEMCAAFIMYYNKIDEYMLCGSDILSEEYREYFLGVNNITWNESQLEYIVRTPERLAGLTITEVSDNHVEWDLQRRRELQRFHLTHPHEEICARELYLADPQDIIQNSVGLLINVEVPWPSGSVAYPSHIRPYQPKKSCSFTR